MPWSGSLGLVARRPDHETLDSELVAGDSLASSCVVTRDASVDRGMCFPDRLRQLRLARLLIVTTAIAAGPVATTGTGTPTRSQGIVRTGAFALGVDDATGRGLDIVILDQGFGRSVDTRQTQGELPPEARLTMRSFDAERGIKGANAFGNPTAHGEIVAQTVYDYAPAAHYRFVNYHTTDQFIEAVDWLIQNPPDIVVHANNFIEGPFDGTSAPARAVDRAAAAGILWVNSAGNYGTQHWLGAWTDSDGDGNLDWPSADSIFERPAGSTTTFSLSWENPEGFEPTDLDLVLERRTDNGWTSARESSGRQIETGSAAERILAYTAPTTGIYRLRVVLWAGPEPDGRLSLFSREVSLQALGGSQTSSVPTPGDAAGSLTVGAVDYRNAAIKAYSSHGPTLDGRLKPEVVAPTGTLVRGPVGPRGVGGTSNAAPNAAGAAAVLWSTMRAAGLHPTAADVRGRLVADARDLGAPGVDPIFGAGLVRISTEPPALAPRAPQPGQFVSGRIPVAVSIETPMPIRLTTIFVDGAMIASVRGDQPLVARSTQTRSLVDGVHRIDVRASDQVANLAERAWTFTVDNTTPSLDLIDVIKGNALKKLGRRVRLVVDLRDLRLMGRPGRASLTPIGGSRGRTVSRGFNGGRQTIDLGRVRPGRYRLELTGRDVAGNEAKLVRLVVVNGAPGRRLPSAP